MIPATLRPIALCALLAGCGGNTPTVAATDAGNDVPRDTAVTPDAPGDTGISDGGTPDAGTGAVVLAIGSAGHSCARMADGTVRCWGLDDHGQLGTPTAPTSCTVQGTMFPCSPSAHPVPGISNVTSLGVGNGTTCVVRGTDNAVLCWGLDDTGELGNGTHDTAVHPSPVQAMLPPARQVAVGAFHACAVLLDGTVRCWGSNIDGQVGVAVSPAMCDEGDGTLSPCVPTPTAVPGLTNVVSVALGRWHSCAILADGTVRCWGLADSGQLGDRTVSPDPHPTPVTVATLAHAVELGLGSKHTCARLVDGSVRCWGWSGMGQFGVATTDHCTGSSGDFPCALTPVAVPGVSSAVSVASGRYHTCIALTDGTARCFGRNDSGQIGTGTIDMATVCALDPDTFPCVTSPATVSGLSGAGRVAVGDYHSCAVLHDGNARCWGYNAYGQLGDNSTTDHSAPVTVAGLVP